MYALGSFLTAAIAIFSFISSGLSVTVRINPLGDSITGYPGCWRALLWRDLQNDGIKDIHFVGTLNATDCGFAYDGNNDGHNGFLATDIANQNQLPAWLSQSQPDIVMVHLGTNDILHGIETSAIIAAYSTLVDQMRAQKQTMRILVAQIIPLNPDWCPTCEGAVIDLNYAIPSWAFSKSMPDSPITVVDCWTGFFNSSDTVDGIHPNDAGNIKLANAFLAPLKHEIAVVDGTTSTTSGGMVMRPWSLSFSLSILFTILYKGFR